MVWLFCTAPIILSSINLAIILASEELSGPSLQKMKIGNIDQDVYAYFFPLLLIKFWWWNLVGLFIGLIFSQGQNLFFVKSFGLGIVLALAHVLSWKNRNMGMSSTITYHNTFEDIIGILGGGLLAFSSPGLYAARGGMEMIGLYDSTHILLGLRIPEVVFGCVIIWGFLALLLGRGFIIVYLLTYVTGHIISRFFGPVDLLTRFRTILCNHCLRYTVPLRSRYEDGHRYCEHCQKQVENTRERGKIIITFGDIPVDPPGRAFILSDPAFEERKEPFNVSEVYIDTVTCNIYLVERMITFLGQYTPQRGIKSVHVFYRGNLENLGDNLKNTLLNNFAISPVSSI